MILVPYVLTLAALLPAQDLATDEIAATASAPARVARTAADSPAELAMWLVNLARHQGHLVGRTDPRSASLHVLALLEAAAQTDPQCAEAYYWLFDLEQRMGQAARAEAALARYVQLAPADESARIRLLELRLEGAQTAEKRLEVLRNALKEGSLSPTYESELHYRLAGFHHERRESEQAGRELEDALRLNPMNIAARELAFEVYGETEPALQRVELALQLIASNPTQANLLWELGEFLDALSLHKQAQEWYNRAIALHRDNAGSPIPAEFWHRLAVSYLGSRDYERAREAATKALEADPSCQLARMLRSNAATKLGDSQAAAADLEAVRKEYDKARQEVIKKKEYAKAAEMAWFYCIHQPDKSLAAQLAAVAMEEKQPSFLARLAQGYALHLAGKKDEAVKVLSALAASDQMAALELARIQMEGADKGTAKNTLIKAASIQYSGIAADLIREQLEQLGEKPPAAPGQAKVLAALEKFPRDIFDFHKRPNDFLKFTLRWAEPISPPPGPLNVVLRLENTAPFAISLGDGFMVRPLVALSAQVRTKEEVTYQDYLQVLLNSRRVLIPGDAIEKTIAADVGHFREYLLKSATSDLEITLSAMLDPVFKDGDLRLGPGTLVSSTSPLKRKGLSTRPESVRRILADAASRDATVRMLAADEIGALLAYANKYQSKAAAEQLPVDELRKALAKLLNDPAWTTRAHALVSASWSSLDPTMTQIAASAVQDVNPIIKVLGVRLFAGQQGQKFTRVLERLSKTDPSRFVRMMALSYLPETARAATETTKPRLANDTAP